jgi:adenylate cyclase class IV
MCALHDEIVANRPTYLFFDIEGAEENLVGSSELPGVKKAMVEVHPELIGEASVRSVLGWLSNLGFRQDGDISKDREIYLERR